jgi:hypothetical protein
VRLSYGVDCSLNLWLVYPLSGIIGYLVHTLERRNPDRELLDDLHLLAITFLKKLSVFRENKVEMVCTTFSAIFIFKTFSLPGYL